MYLKLEPISSSAILIRQNIITNIVTTILRDVDKEMKIFCEITGKIIAGDNEEEAVLANSSQEVSKALLDLSKKNRDAYFKAIIFEEENLGDNPEDNTLEYFVTEFEKAFILDYEEKLDGTNGIGTFNFKITHMESEKVKYSSFESIGQLKASEYSAIYRELKPEISNVPNIDRNINS